MGGPSERGNAWGRMGVHGRAWGSRLGVYRNVRLTRGGGVWAISAFNLARMLQLAHVALSVTPFSWSPLRVAPCMCNSTCT